MATFSRVSTEHLNSCHPNLQLLCKEVIKYYDVAIIEGHRSKTRQDSAYANGSSKVQWPNSKHNTLPSLAVDIAPYPIDWRNVKRFYYMHGIIFTLAKQLGIDIRSGADWDCDTDFDDEKFIDLPHIELLGP